MADRYRLLTVLCYPTDATIDDALRAFGRQATEAAHQAARTQDPRDIDAAVTAEAARAEAVASAFENGTLVEHAVGDVVDDIPSQSLPWLLEQGLIIAVGQGETSEEAVGIVNAPSVKRARRSTTPAAETTHTAAAADNHEG